MHAKICSILLQDGSGSPKISWFGGITMEPRGIWLITRWSPEFKTGLV